MLRVISARNMLHKPCTCRTKTTVVPELTKDVKILVFISPFLNLLTGHKSDYIKYSKIQTNQL